MSDNSQFSWQWMELFVQFCGSKRVKERKSLETAIYDIRRQVKVQMAKLEEIRMTKQKIQEHEANISANENFEIEIPVKKLEKKKITGGFSTNCLKCSETCHYPCVIKDDGDKKQCAAMNDSGRCTSCNCMFNDHGIQNFIFEMVTVNEKQTMDALKEKYEKATQAKMSVQDLIKLQEEDIANLKDVIVDLVKQAAACLARLDEIALRPNPLSAPGYIDMLIEGEKSEAKEGFERRIQSLEEMKKDANIISKVENNEELTKEEAEVYAEGQERRKKSGIKFRSVIWGIRAWQLPPRSEN